MVVKPPSSLNNESDIPIQYSRVYWHEEQGLKKPSGSPGFSCCKQAMVRGKQNVRAACWVGDDQINNGKKFQTFGGYDPIRFY